MILKGNAMKNLIIRSFSFFVIFTVATTAQAVVVTSKKTFSIDFKADTRDLHFTIAGQIKNVTVSPDAPDQEQTKNALWSGVWTTPPGAKTEKVTVARKGGGKWDFQ